MLGFIWLLLSFFSDNQSLPFIPIPFHPDKVSSAFFRTSAGMNIVPAVAGKPINSKYPTLMYKLCLNVNSTKLS